MLLSTHSIADPQNLSDCVSGLAACIITPRLRDLPIATGIDWIPDASIQDIKLRSSVFSEYRWTTSAYSTRLMYTIQQHHRQNAKNNVAKNVDWRARLFCSHRHHYFWIYQIATWWWVGGGKGSEILLPPVTIEMFRHICSMTLTIYIFVSFDFLDQNTHFLLFYATITTT